MMAEREPHDFCVDAALLVATQPQLSSRADSNAAGTNPDTEMGLERFCAPGLYSHHTFPRRAKFVSARAGSGVGEITR